MTSSCILYKTADEVLFLCILIFRFLDRRWVDIQDWMVANLSQISSAVSFCMNVILICHFYSQIFEFFSHFQGMYSQSSCYDFVLPSGDKMWTCIWFSLCLLCDQLSYIILPYHNLYKSNSKTEILMYRKDNFCLAFLTDFMSFLCFSEGWSLLESSIGIYPRDCVQSC
jgi:hypothetical protein